MGLELSGNQLLQGMTDVIAGANPELANNNGAFTDVVQNASGDYTLTLDPEFGLTGDVIPEANIRNAVLPGHAQVGAITDTSVQVFLTDGLGTAINIPFGVILTRTLRG